MNRARTPAEYHRLAHEIESSSGEPSCRLAVLASFTAELLRPYLVVESTAIGQMAAVRDGKSLRILYRPDAPRFIRLRVREGARDVGWAVCLNTAMQRDKSFGNMRVGSIIDCFARAEDAWKVAAAATAHLEAAGADLIVSNQSHRAWRAAMEQAGYFSGPSNFILAMSNKLCQRLDPLRREETRVPLDQGGWRRSNSPLTSLFRWGS